jgi:hypothetical protein
VAEKERKRERIEALKEKEEKRGRFCEYYVYNIEVKCN